jgi:ankyrin repeat protein
MSVVRLLYPLACLIVMSNCQMRTAPQAQNNVSKTNNSSQNSALFVGIRSGDPAAVRQALREGADADSKDSSGFTPLLLASLKGNEEIAKLLLEAGASPNSTNEVGETPVMLAIQFGENNVLNLLLDHGADLTLRSHSRGYTALHLAASRENVSALRILLARKADVNSRDEFGNTPLSVAAAKDPEVLQLLLDNGADVNSTNKAGGTSLMVAISSQRNLKLLLEHGADVNARDNDGWTVLEFALLEGCPEIIDLLTRAGAKE